jgi:hypothetical protein
MMARQHREGTNDAAMMAAGNASFIFGNARV